MLGEHQAEVLCKQAGRKVGKQAAVWEARKTPRGGFFYRLKSVRVTDGAGVSTPARTRPSLMPCGVIGADKSRSTGS